MVSDALNTQKKYTVFVRDNFHHMDEEEEYLYGEFDSEVEAVKEMEKIIDLYFQTELDQTTDHTTEELWKMYTTFGDDPYCPGVEFNGWDYARSVCQRLGKS